MATNIKDFASTPLEAKNYILDDRINQKIFDQLIVQEKLAHLKDVGHLNDGVQPVVIFVVGQTGAGKTRLAGDLFGALKARQPAHFIPDVFKTYHPEYTTIIKTAPHLASSATNTDARKWLDQATKWAINRKVDVLIESACRHPDDFGSLISAFHDEGYRTLVALMAVPECLSLLGTMVRYYKRLPEAQSANIPLRLTPRKVHYETYAKFLQDGILAAADFIDNSTTATNVIVVRRNNLVAYQNYPLASIDLERTRPLPAAEHGSFLADYQYVEEQTSKGGLTEATLADVEASLAGLMSMGGRLSASFPALKPLDVEEWDVNKANLETQDKIETVLPQNSILEESARVEP
ncbi:hypothetical protein N8I77_008170 [Diaporthe amygdali]|uniref:Zeta toxin domain-containing protein n=1 Tax=Phomopsis amygdali TaxID=1214568 RepID=A0AAD9SCS0_PHOAM|nr:hypothetical protein N8I77_008170 [Diaporthe amygdali]